MRSARGRSRRTISTQTARVNGLLATSDRIAYLVGCDTLCLVVRPSPRRPRVSDIAAQSGLSRATVDRVLHGREGVRAETVAQVERAVAELERQRTQVSLSGRTLLLDLVMQAPERFSTASREALETELASLRPALLRSRAQLGEQSDPEAAVTMLDRVAERGSDGVILKAPDHPLVAAAVARLAEQGIPVITFVTDVPGSARAAYVGVDNRAAGATAAYLVASWARQRRPGAGDAEQLVVPRRGGARGRLPSDDGRPGAAAEPFTR